MPCLALFNIMKYIESVREYTNPCHKTLIRACWPQVVPCLALFDTMKYIGSDVGTVGFGACMGMSGFMLAMGKRVRLPWLHILSCAVLDGDKPYAALFN